MNAKIALTPGDGIGPEVVNEARLVLEAVAQRHAHQFTFTEHLLGGCAIDAHGTAMPDSTLEACRAADAVLLGAVGGPKWDDPQAKVRPEQGLLAIRKALHPIFPQVASIQLADYKVRILNSNSGTGAITRVLIDWHDGERRWSTVGAGPNILEATWLALADGFEYSLIPREVGAVAPNGPSPKALEGKRPYHQSPVY